jgi:hypothetical protein
MLAKNVHQGSLGRMQLPGTQVLQRKGLKVQVDAG